MTKEKLCWKKHLFLYGLLLIMLLCYHFTIDLSYGDDGFFAHVLDDKTWSQFLTDRYYWSTSRIIIEAIYIPMTQYAPWLWRILNSVIVVVILWQVNDFFGTEEKTKGILTGIVLAAFVPLTAVMGAGWIATTANYVWTVAAGMTALIPVKKWIAGRTVRWWEYILYLVCLLYASNQEQMAALLLGFYLVFGLYLLVRKIHMGGNAPDAGEIHWQYIFFLLIAFGAVRFIANSPGNYWRTQHDIGVYFPEFNHLSTGRKVFLGLLTTGHYYMSAGEKNWIIPLISAVIFAAIIKKSRKAKSKAGLLVKLAVTAIPFLFSVAVGHVCNFLFHQGILHRGLFWLGLFWNDQLPEYVDYTETDIRIEVLCFGVLFFCLFLGIWWAVDTLEEKLLFILLPCAGLVSRIILGFSPSVYASGDRTTFFATFLFLCTAFYLLMHKITQ